MASLSPLNERFSRHLRASGLLKENQRLLLAVSGGIDSMVMLHLFRQSPYPCAIAHCNFCLRGAESQLDEQLVEHTAQEMDLPFFTTSFQTADHASKHKISIQMAARDLRYTWLETIRTKHGYDLIATAHHLSDTIETLLINLTRGTGIEGLQGIPARNGNIIRPLLFATRSEIAAYAAQHNIMYREDRSNQDDKYVRNRIRHHVIPVLQEINPALDQTLSAFFKLTRQYNDIFRQTLQQCQLACVSQAGQETHISIGSLLHFAGYASLLHAMLADFGFTPAVTTDIVTNLTGQPGKLFHAKDFTALIDRGKIIIYPKKDQHSSESYVVDEYAAAVTTSNGQFFMQITDVPNAYKPAWPKNHFSAMADADLLSFPLVLRRWKAGDTMQPLNLKGTKKISDLMIDNKIPLHQKSQVWLLTSNDQIVWASGLAFGDAFKVTSLTKRIFTIEFAPDIEYV